MEKPVQQTKITTAQLKTVTGATLGIWVICFLCSNTLGDSISPKGLKILAAFLSVVFSFRFVSPVNGWVLNDIIVGIVNSALLFITASGVNIITATTVFAPAEAKSPDGVKETVDSLKVKQSSIFPFLRETAWWQDKAIEQKVENLKKSVSDLKSANTSLKIQVTNLKAISQSAINSINEYGASSSSIPGLGGESSSSAAQRAKSAEILREHQIRAVKLAQEIQSQEARIKSLDSMLAMKSKALNRDFDVEGLNECRRKVEELESRLKIILAKKSETTSLQLSKTGDDMSMKLAVINNGDNALKITNVTYYIDGAEYSSSNKTALINAVFNEPQTNTSFVMRPLPAERTLSPKEKKTIFYLGLAPSTVGRNISKVKFSIRIDYENMSGKQLNYNQVITPGGN